MEGLWPAGTAAERQTLAAAMLRLSPWPALLGLLRLSATDPERPAGAAAAALTRWRPEHLANYAPLPPPAPLRGRIEVVLACAAAAPPPDVAVRLQETLRRWPAP